MTLKAVASSADSSMNTAQIPSAWPMTGILVLFCMLLTSSLPPRGMTKSMYLSWARRDDISDRDETDWINVGGIEVVSRAWAMSLESSVAVLSDSLPPLRIAALPTIPSVSPILNE